MNTNGKTAPRRAVLDLAPLELDCMNTLWPMGEGTVREIRDRLAERRPRAYTTIMTIMERLARKGVVERRKVGHGRAYTYRPNLSATAARSQALAQVIENFFAGSKDALLAHLAGATIPASAALAESQPAQAPSMPLHAESGEVGRTALGEIAAQPRARAAAASASASPPVSSHADIEPAAPASSSEPDADPIDDTLL